MLKVQSDESYGNLVHAIKAPLTPHSVLQWRWRVDKLVDEADLKIREGDDSPAKLCVFFAFDASRLSLGERAKLSIARSRTGQDVPAQTLCYVWDNKLPIDTGMPNAFTKRIRLIVLQSGAEKLGQWISQRREIVADYQRMFGDESEGNAPEARGVAVSGRRRQHAWPRPVLFRRYLSDALSAAHQPACRSCGTAIQSHV